MDFKRVRVFILLFSKNASEFRDISLFCIILGPLVWIFAKTALYRP